MSDELDRLKNAMDAAAGSNGDTARDRAISAGMEEFEKNFQGSADPARPTPEQSQWWALITTGVPNMFRRLTTREALLTTASVATIAIAVVVTYDANSLPTDTHGPIVIAEDGTVSGTALAALDKLVVGDDEVSDLQSVAAESSPVDRTDTSVTTEMAAAIVIPVEETESEEIVHDLATRAEVPSGGGYGGISFGGEVDVQYNDADDGDTLAAQLDVTVTGTATQNNNVTSTVTQGLSPNVSGNLADNFPVPIAGSGLGRLQATDSDGEAQRNRIAQSDLAPAAPSVVAPKPINEMFPVEQIPAEGRVAPIAGIVAMQPPLEPEQTPIAEANTEQYPDATVSPLKITNEEPVSTFSIDVDTAAYGIVRSSLMDGYLPPVDAIRTEEIINYFSYDYPLPQENEAPFSTSVTIMDTPWNDDTKLLHIGIQGYDIAIEDRPPVNLVFLIDTSGSMNEPDKLPLLINSFRLMLANLQPDDQVAIVTYAGSAGMALAPTPASDSATILRSLKNLRAGGSTAGQAGLQQAYALAEQMADGNEATGRVILATDGDFNVGISDPNLLQAFVEQKRESGVYLSVLGFGRGNYNDTIMQTLAQNGNGTASYIDTLAEAQKVLVDQIGGALFTIAQDVKIQIEFNPAEIAEYRLIGYETRALNREDFNNDAVDAGDIGSSHSVTAIYEITPVGSPAISVDDLRYVTEPADVAPETNGEYAFLKLRYKNPGEDVSNLITTPVYADADANLDGDVDFAAAVAGFSQILRNDGRIRGWDIQDAIALAQASKGEDPFGYRAEFITMMRLADSLK